MGKHSSASVTCSWSRWISACRTKDSTRCLFVLPQGAKCTGWLDLPATQTQQTCHRECPTFASESSHEDRFASSMSTCRGVVWLPVSAARSGRKRTGGAWILAARWCTRRDLLLLIVLQKGVLSVQGFVCIPHTFFHAPGFETRQSRIRKWLLMLLLAVLLLLLGGLRLSARAPRQRMLNCIPPHRQMGMSFRQFDAVQFQPVHVFVCLFVWVVTIEKTKSKLFVIRIAKSHFILSCFFGKSKNVALGTHGYHP